MRSTALANIRRTPILAIVQRCGGRVGGAYCGCSDGEVGSVMTTRNNYNTGCQTILATAAVTPAFDSASYLLGFTNDVQGTGVFDFFELHRDLPSSSAGAADGVAGSSVENNPNLQDNSVDVVDPQHEGQTNTNTDNNKEKEGDL